MWSCLETVKPARSRHTTTFLQRPDAPLLSLKCSMDFNSAFVWTRYNISREHETVLRSATDPSIPFALHALINNINYNEFLFTIKIMSRLPQIFPPRVSAGLHLFFTRASKAARYRHFRMTWMHLPRRLRENQVDQIILWNNTGWELHMGSLICPPPASIGPRQLHEPGNVEKEKAGGICPSTFTRPRTSPLSSFGSIAESEWLHWSHCAGCEGVNGDKYASYSWIKDRGRWRGEEILSP